MNSQTPHSARRLLAATTGLLGLTMAFYGTPAQAQQSQLDVLRQQIIELQSRLNSLEASQQKTAATLAVPPVVTKSKLPVVISGLVQGQYLTNPDDDRTGTAAPEDTFRFRRGEIRFDFPKITNKVSGSLMFDLAKTSLNGTTSTATTVGTERNSILQEYRISYDLNKTANSSNTIDLGQYKIPFGYEGDQVSSSALQTVERALFFRPTGFTGVSSALRTGGDQRDQGIRLKGTNGQFYYDLGAFNGLGERQDSNDFDSNKAIAARVGFNPKAIQGLNVGLSYAKGSLNNLAFGGSTTNVDRSLYNAYAAYKRDKITAQAEYFHAKAEGNNGADQKARSFYGSLGYLFGSKFEGVLRYDDFDGNTDSNNAKTKESTIGLNYYLNGTSNKDKINQAKIQTNLVKVERPTSGGKSQDSLELRTQVQVAF